MEVSEHVDELERQGRGLADAAATAGLDAPVPACPGWVVRDLLRHTGGVHDWARRFVEADPTVDMDAAEEDLVQPTGDPVAWYRDRNAELVAALRAAPPDLAVPAFLAAPSPLAFWARRQAHEAAVHRADADAAAGGARPDAFPLAFAVDGVDELLTAFMSRPGRLRSPHPYALAVAPDDAAERWIVEVGPDGATARRGSGPVRCTLRGAAGRLYLFLWNRLPDVTVDGEAELATTWREQAKVVWD
jgi:uncharacterized protein (TIGR03083 family)